LNIAFEKKSEIDKYIEINFDALEEDYFSPHDWGYFRMINNFLQPFYRAILETQGDQTMFDRVFFIMNMFIKYIEKSLVRFIFFFSTFN
jgi:hypothetical protein